MAAPNNSLTKVNNFVPKVYDRVKMAWVPLYIPPDATEIVKGMTWLADDYMKYKDYNADTGMTAITPKGVYNLKLYVDAEIKKITDSYVKGAKGDRETEYRKGNVNLTAYQVGAVESLAPNTGSAGSHSGDILYGNAGANAADTHYYIIHNASGTAYPGGTADSRVVVGLDYYNSQINSTSLTDDSKIPTDSVVYNAVHHLDGSWITTGTIPLERLPQGALERLIKVADKNARFALTKEKVQTGDTVLQLDTKTMYIVVDDTKLNSEDGYQEYKAGTAVNAENATYATSAGSVEWSNVKNKPTASDSTAGIIKTGYTANDKNYPIKVDANGNAYVSVPWSNTWQQNTVNANGYVTAPSASNANMVWKTDASGNPGWRTDANTTYSVMAAATANADGASGLVPKPTAGNQGKYLRADGTWNTPPGITSAFTGASATANGTTGLVPAPTAGNQNKFLRADGSWATVTTNANTVNTAGYVSAPTASNPNKVWKTDENGNPAWRNDDNNSTKVTNLETQVANLKSIVKTLCEKVYSANVDIDNGTLTFNKTGKIPIGNINVWSADAAPTNSANNTNYIMTRDNVNNNDVWWG